MWVQKGRDAILRLLAECWAVATAAGFPPRSAFTEFVTTFYTTVESPAKPSMLRDIERGSVTEGNHILGDLAARALGVATPILDLPASMSRHTRPDTRAKQARQANTRRTAAVDMWRGSDRRTIWRNQRCHRNGMRLEPRWPPIVP
jgi:hypothetical protein